MLSPLTVTIDGFSSVPFDQLLNRRYCSLADSVVSGDLLLGFAGSKSRRDDRLVSGVDLHSCVGELFTSIVRLHIACIFGEPAADRRVVHPKHRAQPCLGPVLCVFLSQFLGHDKHCLPCRFLLVAAEIPPCEV